MLALISNIEHLKHETEVAMSIVLYIFSQFILSKMYETFVRHSIKVMHVFIRYMEILKVL